MWEYTYIGTAVRIRRRATEMQTYYSETLKANCTVPESDDSPAPCDICHDADAIHYVDTDHSLCENCYRQMLEQVEQNNESEG